MANDCRRHEKPDEAKDRAEKRRKRVLKLRVEDGRSLRWIARAVCVSEAQVRRDLELKGAPPGAIETKEVDDKNEPDVEVGTGPQEKDKPRCARCQRLGAYVVDCKECEREQKYEVKGSKLSVAHCRGLSREVEALGYRLKDDALAEEGRQLLHDLDEYFSECYKRMEAERARPMVAGGS